MLKQRLAAGGTPGIVNLGFLAQWAAIGQFAEGQSVCHTWHLRGSPQESPERLLGGVAQRMAHKIDLSWFGIVRSIVATFIGLFIKFYKWCEVKGERRPATWLCVYVWVCASAPNEFLTWLICLATWTKTLKIAITECGNWGQQSHNKISQGPK